MQEIKLELAIEEVNLILEALGSIPFARVYTLIGKIQQQAAQQLPGTSGANAEARPPAAAGIAGPQE